jgi:hypothetical protein
MPDEVALMPMYYHVVRMTISRNSRARYQLASLVDSWGSGCLSLVLRPEAGSFYSENLAHARAQELSRKLAEALKAERMAGG